MRYMLLLYVAERPHPGTPAAAWFYPPILAFERECRERGVLVSAAPLEGPESAATVRERDGRLESLDGPAARSAFIRTRRPVPLLRELCAGEVADLPEIEVRGRRGRRARARCRGCLSGCPEVRWRRLR
jgi:hypothetical protein